MEHLLSLPQTQGLTSYADEKGIMVSHACPDPGLVVPVAANAFHG